MEIAFVLIHSSDPDEMSHSVAFHPYHHYLQKYPLTGTVKPVLSGHSKRRPKICFFNTDYRLIQIKSIAECSKASILQYFRTSLSYHLPLRPLFCLFKSGRLRQGTVHVYVSGIQTVSSQLQYHGMNSLFEVYCRCK